MTLHHVPALAAVRTTGRCLRGAVPAALLALAASGLAPGCSPAGSEPIPPPPPGAAADRGEPDGVAAGKRTFEQQCSVCHTVTDGPPRLGPALGGVLRRPRLHTGRPATEPVVREIILEGSGAMRAFRDSLTEPQLDELIAYLKTL